MTTVEWNTTKLKTSIKWWKNGSDQQKSGSFNLDLLDRVLEAKKLLELKNSYTNLKTA